MALSVADKWYELEKLSDGVSRIQETHVASWLKCNIWHIRGRDRDLIVDTGMGLRSLQRELPTITERPLTAIITHCHFDHSGGLHEFNHRCGHPVEADVMEAPTPFNTVADTGFVRAETFSALPYEGFDYRTYLVKPAPLTHLLNEGDVVDLGDRVFEVFHLPGHSPGSIALYERATKILFSGDVIYDGALLDNLYHSDAGVLTESLRRLRELPVTTVHGGHYGSFGHARMVELIDIYLSGGNRIMDIDDWIKTP